jgi:calcium-dependent protein kinase
LVEGYKRIFGDNASEVVEELFLRVDADGSGEIDYSEWIVATINK